MADTEDPHTGDSRPPDPHPHEGWNRPNGIETDSYGRRWEVDVDGRRRALDPPTAAQRVRTCASCLAAVALLVALVTALVRALS